MDFHRLVVGNLCMDSVRHLQAVPCAVRKEDQNSQQDQDCCCVPKLRQQMGCKIEKRLWSDPQPFPFTYDIVQGHQCDDSPH